MMRTAKQDVQDEYGSEADALTASWHAMQVNVSIVSAIQGGGGPRFCCYITVRKMKT